MGFVSQKQGLSQASYGAYYKNRQYDVVIMIGSDQRLKLFRALLNNEVIPIVIGESPITSDVYVDPDNLRSVIKSIKEEGS